VPSPAVAAMRKWHLAIAIAVVVLDRSTKWLVENRLDLHDTINLIPGFFRITHVQNKGAAFGLFAESNSEWRVTILVMFSVVALIVVAGLLWKNHHSMVTTGIGLSLILGGALGNLWDRVVAGHVVDFLDFYLGSYHWPAFNVADSAIVSGALLLVAEILFAHTTDETPPLAEQ
jgi:signal peptidase II